MSRLAAAFLVHRQCITTGRRLIFPAVRVLLGHSCGVWEMAWRGGA